MIKASGISKDEVVENADTMLAVMNFTSTYQLKGALPAVSGSEGAKPVKLPESGSFVKPLNTSPRGTRLAGGVLHPQSYSPFASLMQCSSRLRLWRCRPRWWRTWNRLMTSRAAAVTPSLQLPPRLRRHWRPRPLRARPLPAPQSRRCRLGKAGHSRRPMGLNW